MTAPSNTPVVEQIVLAERDIQDVVSARDFLLHCFPLNSARGRDKVAASDNPSNITAPRYLELRIVDRERCGLEDVRLRVGRVQFRTVNHDRGWCNDEDRQGTYHGFTWFEAAIPRSAQANLTVASKAPTSDAPVEVPAAHGSGWEVHKRFCASEAPTKIENKLPGTQMRPRFLEPTWALGTAWGLSRDSDHATALLCLQGHCIPFGLFEFGVLKSLYDGLV
ncbi:hypothetical protein K438DRAFT_1975547 [Mycena galopus ATCC 62051]|nr:hypothetical protein K438DRAFT_1975547 [Mycena galopus ATCC 62051]